MSALMLAVTSIDTNAPLDSLLSMKVGGSLILCLLLTTVFWSIEKRAHDPIVRPALFDSPQISKSCIISCGVSALQTGTIFLPVLLVDSLGVSTANSALLLLPGVVAATIAAPVFGKLINRTGTRLIIVVSQIMVLVSLMVYAFTDLNYASFLFASILGGVGSSGLVGAPIRFIVLAETGNQDRASAQGLLSVTSSVGRLLGASVVGAVAASLGGSVSGYQAAFAVLTVLGVFILFAAMSLNNKAIEQADTAAA
jgi:MFS family permease